MHLLRLVCHLSLQHADGLNLRRLVHHAALSDQRHVLHVSCRLREERQSRVSRFCRLSLGGDDADLLLLTRDKINVVHISRHHQLDLLFGALVLLELQDVTHLFLRCCGVCCCCV